MGDMMVRLTPTLGYGRRTHQLTRMTCAGANPPDEAGAHAAGAGLPFSSHAMPMRKGRWRPNRESDMAWSPPGPVLLEDRRREHGGAHE